MVNVSVDFNEKVGKIKPMHAVNNGPVCKVGSINQGWNDSNNLKAFTAAGFPYANIIPSIPVLRYRRSGCRGCPAGP